MLTAPICTAAPPIKVGHCSLLTTRSLQGWAILDVTPKHVTSTWYFTPNINRPGDYTLVRFPATCHLPSQTAGRAPAFIRDNRGQPLLAQHGIAQFRGDFVTHHAC